MPRKRSIILTSIPFMACFFGWGEPVVAVGEQKQLTQLRQQIKRVDADIHQLQQEKERLTEQLKSLEIEYGRVAHGVKKLQQQVDHSRHALESIGDKMTLTRKSIARQKSDLENLVKSAHAMGGRERLKVILNQQDPALSSRMLVYYDFLNRARLTKLHAVEDNYHDLQRLEREKQKETDLLSNSLEQRRREQNELQRVRQKREKLVQQLDQLYSAKKTQLSRLQNDERKLSQLIASLQKARVDFPFQEGPDKPFSQLKGVLPWPLQGRLVKKFGSARSESRWDGVLINAKEGADIHAVTRGRVVYADWLRGYGLLTIIDHGKGYMTLYAFNQSLYKAEGDWVEAGDVIASVGKSGGRSQAALYFGIRKKGKPVDPLKWCRRVRKGRVG